MNQHWVILQTGSNQEFIFTSNRRKYAVGASQQLTYLKPWVAEALKALHLSKVETVVATSAIAQLLVPDEETGREIVTYITQKALNNTPGVDLWGYVGPPFSGNNMAALRQAMVEAGHLRGLRKGPTYRYTTYPFSQTCSVTGSPATHERFMPGYKTHQPVSAAANAVYDSADKGFARLQETYGVDVIGESHTDEGVSEKGWVAVIHADGNGVGDVIRSIQSTEDLRDFSKALETVTQQSLLHALYVNPNEETPLNHLTRQPYWEGARGWLLPLIVGGDDVTCVCDARYAVPFVRAFLQAFMAHANNHPVIRRIAGNTQLAASAGIAVVKPKYPFSAAYNLAEDLTSSAKKVKAKAAGASSWDIHVLHDSVQQPLSELRQTKQWRMQPEDDGQGDLPSSSTDMVRLAAGPFVVLPEESQERNTWAAARCDTTILAAADALSTAAEQRVSASAWQTLREAMMQGGGAPTLARQQVKLRSSDPLLLNTIDNNYLLHDGDEYFTNLLTARDLATISVGTIGPHQTTQKQRKHS